MADPKIPNDSPVFQIQKALADAEVGTTQLAGQVGAGKKAESPGILQSVDRFAEASETLQGQFPSYFASPIDPAALTRMKQAAANFSAAQEQLDGANEEVQQVMGQVVATGEAAMNEKLTPLLPKMLEGAIGQVAATAQQEGGFEAKAENLAKDLGIHGKLSEDEMNALSDVLRDVAVAKLERIKTMQQNVGKLDAGSYLAALVADMERGAEVLQKLKADLA